MTKTTTPNEALENEWYHVRHSGEIPEVALHSSMYYLTEDPDGPQLSLSEDDLATLHDAAMERYWEIIIRDITPANRDEPLYRGVLRSIANWRRAKRFARRHDLDLSDFRSQLPHLLNSFLQQEIEDVVNRGIRSSSINCTYEDLQSFALEFGYSLDSMQKSLRQICSDIQN